MRLSSPSRVGRWILGVALVLGMGLCGPTATQGATTFAVGADNVSAYLGAPYTAGSGTVQLATGYGATLAAKIASMQYPAISPTSPLRFTLVAASAFDAFGRMLAGTTKQAVYLATGLSGDNLTGVTVEQGSTDQAFKLNDVFAVYQTSRSMYAIQNAVNSLESMVNAVTATLTAPTPGPLYIQGPTQSFDSAGNYSFSHLLTDSSTAPLSVIQTPPVVVSNTGDTGTDTPLTNLYTAFKFTAAYSTPRAFGMKFKKSAGTLTNPASTLTVQVYTDNAGVPGTLLSGSQEPFHFGNVTTSYVQLNPGGGSMTLTIGQPYWIVLIQSAAPAGVTISTDSGMASGGTTVATSANGTAWTATAGQPQLYYQLYGSNGQIVLSSQTAATVNSFSSTGQGIFATSVFWRAIQAVATYGPAYYGTSVLGDGATLTTVYGNGVIAKSQTGIAGNFSHSGPLPQSTTNPVVYAGRLTSAFGAFSSTGDVLKVEDVTIATGNLLNIVKQGVSQVVVASNGVMTLTQPLTAMVTDTGGQVYNAAAATYGGGVKAGVVFGTDGAMTAGTTFTAASAPFLASMVTKSIEFDGPGSSPTVATINAFNSASSITISYTSPGTISNVRYSIASDSTAAIQAAIDAANAAGGGTVLIPPGSYHAGGTTAVQLKANVTLSMRGATLVKRGGGGTTHVIEVNGTLGTATALTGNVAQGALSVPVTSAAGLVKDDFVLLYDLTYKYGTAGRNQEMARIAAVSGNTLTLANPTYGSYTMAASGAVAEITGGQNCAIEGGTLHNRSVYNQSGGLFRSVLGYRLSIVDCAAIGPCDDPGFQINQSQRVKIDRWSARDGINQTAGGYAYGVQVGESSLYVDITHGFSSNIRENPITDGARGVQFTVNTCVGHQDDGVNTHGAGCENVLIADNLIIDCKGSGITIGYGADNAADKDITVSRNMIINSVFSGITFASNDNGLHHHQRVKIQDNTIDGFGQSGIYGRLVDFADVTGNSITSHNTTGTTAGINVSLLTHFRIKANDIHDSTSASGILYTQVTNGIIESNLLQNTGPAAFLGTGPNTELQIRWNRTERAFSLSTFAGDEVVERNTFAGVTGPSYHFVKAGAITDADVAVARDGQMGINSVTGQLMYRVGGAWVCAPKLAYAQTAATTVVNTAVETTVIAAGTATPRTIPANSLVVGKTIKFTASGSITTVAAPGTLGTKFKFGSTILNSTGNFTLVASMTGSKTWRYEGEVTCVTTGATGTVATQGVLTISNSTGTGATQVNMANAVPVTVNTTIDNIPDLTVTFSVADPAEGIICSNFLQEWKN